MENLTNTVKAGGGLMLKRVALVIFVTLALVGCREEAPVEEAAVKVNEPSPSGDYYPIAKGDMWRYVAGFPPHFTDTTRYEVVDEVKLINGQTAYKVTRDWRHPERSMTDTFYVSKTETEVGYHVSPEDTISDPLLRLPLEAGTQWVLSGDTLMVARFMEIVGMDTVTVSGKVYADCFKLECRQATPDSVLWRRFDWYAPGVGRVRTTAEGRGPGGRTRVQETILIEYKVH
jgi:hypothetical protein